MIPILRSINHYFGAMRKIYSNSYIFVSVIFILTILFFSSDQIWSKLPGTLWDLSENTEQDTNSLEEDVSKKVTSTIKVKKGDTLSSILAKQKIPIADRMQITKLANENSVISKLTIGQTISFFYNIELIEQLESELVEEKIVLDRMSIATGKFQSIDFVREGEQFVIKTLATPIKKVISRYDTTIDTNIISSLKKAGLDTNCSIQLVNAYSYQIDLQRQIRKGDKISVIVEKFITEDNEFSHYGRILFASLLAKGNSYNIYSYSSDNKNYRFFNENGQSIKGTLLQTPVDVVRISSHYGYRKKHPVLGYGRMHKGVDFAASTGTPIYAAGDGVIDFIGWKNGYGRFIIVKHNATLSTAYAHASKFAKNLQKGSRVRQGQVIAYVGSTGHATGAHLHYEVRINGQQVNPLKFKSTPGLKLAGSDLNKFNNFKKKIQQLDAKLIEDNNLDETQFKL
ncbi:MAG: peptidoglycan DD-metalloendopeptidase family protein [Rickettsiaceae bacterium]|nr:peptidoglycan DD-metalloendopeptidase family protein [Rickettsiaceae bacterium]